MTLRRLNRMGWGRGGATPYFQRLIDVVGAANLFRYWPLDEASGSTAVDKSANAGNGAYSTSTTPLLAQTGWGDGKTSVNFRSNSWLNPYSVAFNAGLNKDEFSCGFIYKPIVGEWGADGLQHNILSLVTDTNNYIEIRLTSSGTIQLVSKKGGGTTQSVANYTFLEDFTPYVMTFSKTANAMALYRAGQRQYTDWATAGDWAGNLSNTYTRIGSGLYFAGNQYAGGYLQHFWWANAVISETQMRQIALPNSSSPSTRNFLVIGDSKSSVLYTNINWRTRLANSLWNSTKMLWNESPAAVAVDGMTTATMQARCDADIAAMTTVPDYILYNLGANDMGTVPGAEWAVNTNYILDAYHTAFPSAIVLMAKIWRRSKAAGIAAINTMIDDNVLPTRTGWLSVALDEATIIEGGDDGATYTTDGVHYSLAGAVLIAAAWKTAISP